MSKKSVPKSTLNQQHLVGMSTQTTIADVDNVRRFRRASLMS